MSETNRIEYKSVLTKDLDLEKEVVAFLNYHEGGLVYIGIDKTGTILGVADPDGDMLKIKDRIKHNISPSAMGLFDVVSEEKEGKALIKIIVASGSEKPYFKKKYGFSLPLATIIFIRALPSFSSETTSNRPMADGEILCLIRSFIFSISPSGSATPRMVPVLSIPIYTRPPS